MDLLKATARTHDEIVKTEKIRPYWMDGLLGLPVRMEKRLDVIGSEFKDGERVWHTPRVE